MVQMGYPSGALNSVSGWEAARKQILTQAASESGNNDSRGKLMRAYLVPPLEIGGPDINFDVVKEETLLPPPSSNERLVTRIVEVYWSLQKWHELSSRPGTTADTVKPKEGPLMLASASANKKGKDAAKSKSKNGPNNNDKKRVRPRGQRQIGNGSAQFETRHDQGGRRRQRRRL